MNIHKTASLTPLGRGRLVRLMEEGSSCSQAGRLCGCTAKTAAKWWRRVEREGAAGLVDRSSRPHVLRNPTAEVVCARLLALRRQRLTGAPIARKTGVSPATVSRVLRRAGLSRLRALEPAAPVRRYERAHPGELIHLDIKKLGRFETVGHRVTGDPQHGESRGAGCEVVHVCIDDSSRLSFTQIHPDEKAVGAVAHLKAAVAWYAAMGVTVERVMTPSRDISVRNALPGSGQRRLRSVKAGQGRRPDPRHRTYPRDPLHAQDQWKGRALHSNCSARRGRRARLPDLRPTRRRPARLGPPLQLAPATLGAEIQTATQPVRIGSEQPVEAPQLGHIPINGIPKVFGL